MERIYGEQVYLRPITEEDTDDIIRWRNSEAVRPYFIYQKPFTREGHLHWLETMIYSGKGYQFIVCQIEDDKPIGSAYFRDYDKEHNKIEYGMFLGENGVKSKGIGTEIFKLSLQFAFEVLDIHKVYSRVFSDNAICLRSCEKVGIKQEGYFKDEVCINGEYKDVVMLGIINPNHAKQ